jgi:hypothetical protein
MIKSGIFSPSPSLHLGPMSRNVIAASVAFSKANAWPICLIASRRQIDAEAFGGGYVDSLTTEMFAKQLRSATDAGHVILARDHGGPYQRAEEEGLSLDDALDSVEKTYFADISSGFNIIHIDPEKCIKSGDSGGLRMFAELTQELLRRCFGILDKTGRSDVRFEVGSDEGIGMEFAPDQWAEFLNDIQTFCIAKGRPTPVAIAVPLGTKVKEAENVGGLALNAQDPFWLKRVQAMQEIAERFGLKLKLHNADYISVNTLKLYRELGVEQVNVAPELGVVESRALLQFLRENTMKKQADAFLSIAYRSGKWERWLKPDTKASDEDKAIIAGHYIFGCAEYRELLKDIQSHPASEGLDSFLVNAITGGIHHYYTVLEEAHASLRNVSA